MNQQLPPLKEPEGKKLKPLSNGGGVGSILVGVAIAIVGLAIAAGLVLFLLSNRETEEPLIPIPEGSTKGSGKVTNQKQSPVTPPGTRSQDSVPTLNTFFSEHGWAARLPDSPKWSGPEDEPTESGLLYRTRVYGPEGAVIVIDFTPSERPNPSNVVNTKPASLPNSPNAQVVRIQGGDLCPAEITCVDYLIPVGDGGYAVLVGWPGNNQGAAELAKVIADSIMPSPGY